MISRTQRTLSVEDQGRIVDTVVRRRRGVECDDVLGFSASVPVESVREQDYVLVPGRYVGADVEADTSVGTVATLLAELARLERRAEEVNAVVERQLSGVRPWIR
jgi:type I restriction enzyme M protein